jgi:ABC-type Zn2+ transport system substrate-binding protein/surface adhesin
VAPISADQPDGRDVGDVDLADFAATAEALVQRARQDMDEEREAPVAAGQENDHDHDHNHDHHHDPIGEDEIEGMDDWNGILEREWLLPTGANNRSHGYHWPYSKPLSKCKPSLVYSSLA